MKKIIIPGFGTDESIFPTTIKEEALILPNKSHTYEETEKVLDNLNLRTKSCHILGWSLGALFALKWVSKNKNIVSTLFLTGATARFSQKINYDNGIPESVLFKMIKLVRKRKDLVMSDFYSSMLSHVENNEEYLDILMDKVPFEEILLNGLNELVRIDLLEEIKKIDIPVLIFQGIYDKITPLRGAEIMCDLMKNATLVKFEGGHVPFLEDPGECSAQWENFISQNTV